MASFSHFAHFISAYPNTLKIKREYSMAPYDGSGNFSNVPGSIVSDGMTVQPSQHNPPLQDIAAGLSQVVLRSGVAPMTGNLNMNGNKATGLADGTAAQDAATFRQTEGEIGDFKDTVRDISGGKYLRRDGAIYDNTDYPSLAALLPAASSATYTDSSIGAGSFISIRRVTPTALIAVTGTTGLNGQVYTATYGDTWTQRTLTGFSINQSVEKSNGAFGNGIYMVSGHDSSFNHKVWTSSSLAGPWTASSNITTAAGVSGPLCFFDGYFYSVHNPTGEGAKVYRSTNGASWALVHTSALALVVDIRGGTNEIVMVHSDGSVARSTNGTLWTSASIPESVTSLAWNDGLARWVAGASSTPTVYVSATGASWEARSLSSFLEGGVIVSDATDGFVAVPTSAPFTSIGVSTNGLDFFSVVGPGGTGTVRTVARNAQTNTEFLIGKLAGDYSIGALVVLEDKFRVPSDDPLYGWVKAL